MVYPQIELGGSPEAFARIATSIEDMGLKNLVLYDHVVGAVHEGRDPPLTGPYTQDDPFHDPFVAFGYAAGLTKELEFVTGVLILPQRQTVLVAKQATDVALFSGGRLKLGVGIGWNFVEYDALGQDFSKRGKRLDEQIPFLRRLWSESAIEWQGQFDRIDRGNIIPRPSHPIPILCGGVSDAAYNRAARLADGFIFAGGGVPRIIPIWQSFKERLAQNGRSFDGFIGHSLIMNPERTGIDPQGAADDIRRWQDAGGTDASIVTMGRGYTTVEQHLDYVNEVYQLVK